MVRELTVTEQLVRNASYRGINDIKHPTYGIIPVDRANLEQLLTLSEDELVRLGKESFQSSTK
jgi:hypothetical protein